MKLRIEKAIYGGAGLARATEGPLAGKTVFVALALPGELVEARIVDDRRSFAQAELDQVVEAAPARTTPACPYFGACGGCQYQHATYANQVEMKAAILRETLERAHLEELPPITTVRADPWRYRNRIRLVVEKTPFALGYRERRSHASVAVNQCPIAAPLLERALRATNSLGAKMQLAAMCDEIEFFTNSAEDQLVMTLHAGRAGRSGADGLGQLAQALGSELPELRGAGLFSAESAKQPSRMIAHWGEPSLHYTAAGSEYRVSLGSFFQVNRFRVDTLVSWRPKAEKAELPGICTRERGSLRGP
jgi:23S rRNA (uracil1939-C5)-methyltransferase